MTGGIERTASGKIKEPKGILTKKPDDVYGLLSVSWRERRERVLPAVDRVYRRHDLAKYKTSWTRLPRTAVEAAKLDLIEELPDLCEKTDGNWIARYALSRRHKTASRGSGGCEKETRYTYKEPADIKESRSAAGSDDERAVTPSESGSEFGHSLPPDVDSNIVEDNRGIVLPPIRSLSPPSPTGSSSASTRGASQEPLPSLRDWYAKGLEKAHSDHGSPSKPLARTLSDSGIDRPMMHNSHEAKRRCRVN